MSKFDVIVSNIRDITSLTQLSDDDVRRISERYQGLDEDYITFLQEVGWGDLGVVQLYNQPTPATSVYHTNRERLRTVLLFGDDMQGHCFGFDVANKNRVVEVNTKGDVDLRIEDNFMELMHALFR